MAKPDTVYSLFGMKTPQQVAADRIKQQQLMFQQQKSGFGRTGLGIGLALRGLFGGVDQEMETAKELETIRAEYQPGNLQNMAETYTRLKEAGAPAETLNKLSADITTASQAFNERAQQQKLKSLQEGITSDPKSMRQTALQLMEQGFPVQARELLKEANQAEKDALQIQKTQAEIEQGKKEKPISPEVYTQLVANHGYENASKFVQTRDLKDLGPRLTPKETKVLSDWGKKLKDAGYVPGSPAFEEQMKVVNKKQLDAIGKQVTVKQMNSLEQKEFLGQSIMGDPRYDAVLEMESKLAKASSVMPNARRGERPAVTLLQRTISDLYNSDTRAASEIDRLVNANKSITETVTDAGTQFVFGELTPQALTELQNVLNNANTLINDTKRSIVTDKLGLFESDITDDTVRQAVLKSYGGTVQADPLGIR